jgi:predicted sulfurtransferase
MVLYIWLLWHQVVIYCTQGVGCIQSSMAHFEYVLGLGVIEVIFEIGGIIKVFVRKDQKDLWEKKDRK